MCSDYHRNGVAANCRTRADIVQQYVTLSQSSLAGRQVSGKLPPGSSHAGGVRGSALAYAADALRVATGLACRQGSERAKA
jgi:hypothetical protein